MSTERLLNHAKNVASSEHRIWCRELLRPQSTWGINRIADLCQCNWTYWLGCLRHSGHWLYWYLEVVICRRLLVACSVKVSKSSKRIRISRPPNKTFSPRLVLEGGKEINRVSSHLLKMRSSQHKFLQGVESPLCSVSYPLRCIYFLIKVHFLSKACGNRFKDGTQKIRMTWYITLIGRDTIVTVLQDFSRHIKSTLKFFSAGFR
jgi:hypothetical protein